MTTTIGNRLDIYGPSTCPICGNSRETVFGKAGELVCRAHPGHPLYEAETPAEDRIDTTGTSALGRIA